MENQPSTGRPWFRMASLARMETAAPATAPPPPRPTQPPLSRVPMVRPPVALPQSPPPPPPPQQQETRPMSTVNGAVTESQQPPRPRASPPPPPSPRQRVLPRTPTPPESPRVIRPSSQTLPESPRTTQLRPIIAPRPPYPEPEPKPLKATQTKSIPMQEGDTNGNTKPMHNINGEPRTNSRSQAPPLSPMREYRSAATDVTSVTQKKDDYEREMKILTMAGENMGAYMELTSPNRHHQHLNMKQQNGLEYHQATESESGCEDGKNKDKKKATKSATKGKPMFALANSNVQSINNSILFSSSCSQHSPGVHTTLTSHRQPKGTTTNSSSAKGNSHPK